MLYSLAPCEPRLPRGSHPPRPPSSAGAQHGALKQHCVLKHSWAGAATPTQPTNITQASATTERLDNDVSHGTPLAGKGNPTWPFSNAPETMTPWRNDLLQATAPRPGAPAGLAARAMTLITAAINEIAARLADIPRRIGARLFLDLDEEAYWRGWQVTPLHGGLGRDYRDFRFETLNGPAGPAGQVPLGQAPPDGDW